MPLRVAQVYGPRWPWLVLLYVSLSIVCGYVSWSRVVIDDKGVAWTNQDSVDLMVATRSTEPAGLALFPQMRSRMLVPVIIVGAKDYLGIPYKVTHDALRLVFIILAALLFHWHLRTWFSLAEAFTGTVLVLATIAITFNSWFPTTSDFPELVGMTVCAGLLIRQRWIWMLAALFVYTLNRETSVILLCVAVAWLYNGKGSIAKLVLVAALILGTWAAAYEFARVASNVGPGSFVVEEAKAGESGGGLISQLVGLVQGSWPRRRETILSLLRNPHPYNVNWSPLLVFNIFWFLPLANWRAVPGHLKRLYLGGLLAGLPAFILVGVLNEAGRHMIPLYPLVFPAGLYVLFQHVLPPSAGASAEMQSRDVLWTRN